MRKFVLPALSEAERMQSGTGKLLVFCEVVVDSNYQLQELVGKQADEIAILKGEKKRPQFKPSGMHEEAKPSGVAAGDRGREQEAPKVRRPGSDKKAKTAELKIDQDLVIQPAEPIPPGSRFKGYHDWVVQGLEIRTHNIRYRLARWQTPDGQSLIGQLPKEVQGRHFAPDLVSYILYQHHHCQVTQPLLHEQLREWGVDISSGQVNAILLNDHERFHGEKDALLSTGLSSSSYVTVDDTGTRHKGNNAYVQHIGNEHFAWFETTMSKSRINFLELLCAGQIEYQINPPALAYMKAQGLAQALRESLRQHESTHFTDPPAWQLHLDALGIDTERCRRIATEGALLGSLQLPNLVIVSDDAGQFDVLLHGLCWIHSERLVHKLLPLHELHRVDIARVRNDIWTLYADLKLYKDNPSAEQKVALAERFDTVFQQQTSYMTLNLLLRRIHRNKAELLLVLDRPEIPLHTNGSEQDVRDYVKKRKISGGTRSDLGRKCRDTFTSLKKSARKLGISFWKYLRDRISYRDQIPLLSELLELRLACSADARPPIDTS
jgi:hypothetical protein